MVFKKAITKAALAVAFWASMISASWAQLSDWSYSATIYLFTPDTEVSQETALGTVDGTLSFSDALKNLDLAFMGTFTATNGRWSLLADYNYTRSDIQQRYTGRSKRRSGNCSYNTVF